MGNWRNNEHYADPTAYSAMRRAQEPGTGRIRRGEMYYVSGAQTENSMSANRPAIIISNDAGNRFGNEVIVVWLTRKIKKPLPTHVLVKTDNVCTALCEHIETVAKSRVENYIGMLTEREMRALDEALSAAIGLPDRVSSADRSFPGNPGKPENSGT